MPVIYGIFVLIGTAGSAIISQYKDMDKAPDDSSKIATLSDKPKLELCLIGCSQNLDCKSIVYDGSLCYLYDTTRGSVSLKPEERGVAQISFGCESLINLCTAPGTYCEASSSAFYCHSAIDGFVEIGYGKEWASAGEDYGAWLKVTFGGWAEISKIQVWHRCSRHDQYRTFAFEFSDKSILQGTCECSSSTNANMCPDPVPFNEFMLSPAKKTKWVTLTGHNPCVQQLGHNGFREVMYLGRFSDN